MKVNRQSPASPASLSPAATLRAAAAVAVVIGSMLFAACSSTPERPATYKVRKGDTLYSIAWRHRLDYQDVARWNDIGRDYVIHPGQVLKLYPSVGRVVQAKPAPASPPTQARSQTRPKASARSKTASRSASRAGRSAAVSAGSSVRWLWPVNGGTATLTSRPNGGHGLTITGRLGEEIRSAGAGRVVYTGSGLLGYGQLVIIKHNETYLSAYGHTQSVSVREGDAVEAGQRIATMGAGPRGVPMLYFEIRVNGAPGNPLTLLPPRR